MSSSDDYYDLTPYIPQEAIDLRDAKPNITQAYDTISAVDEGYDGRTGDLANLIQSAADSNQIVNLSGGTFEMESGVSVSSGTVGVVGDGSATVYHSGVDTSYLFDVQGPDTFVLEGTTFDITEDAGGLDTDVGLASAEITNEIWCEDIELRGTRHLNQDYDGDGEVEPPPSNSRRMTFLMELTTYDGTGYYHNCRFPDGGTDEAATIGTVGHSIGPNADPSHIGTNVWHECLARGFVDNGFYVNNSTGSNILWNCEAYDNAAGNMRLGDNDVVIGGYSEITGLPNDRLGQCLSLSGGENIEVYGIELYGEGESFGDSILQIRNSDAGDNINCTIEKVTVRAVDGDTRPVRISSSENITLRDCYILDEGPYQGGAIGSMYGDGGADGENLYVHSVDGDALYLNQSGDSFTYEGETFTGGPTSYTASEVGFGDPRPLPEFYFGESSTTEYDVVFEIVDDETSETIEGATVSVGDQSDITTSSDGIADFGALGTGDYSYSVTADGYNGVSGTYTNNTNATNTVALNSVSEDDGQISLQVTNRDSVGIGDVTVTLYEGSE